MKENKTFEDTLSSRIVKSIIEAQRRVIHYARNEQIADIYVDRSQSTPILVYKVIESRFGNKVFGYDFKDGRYYINKEEKDIINYILDIYFEKNKIKKQDMQEKIYKRVEKMHKKREQLEKRRNLER